MTTRALVLKLMVLVVSFVATMVGGFLIPAFAQNPSSGLGALMAGLSAPGWVLCTLFLWDEESDEFAIGTYAWCTATVAGLVLWLANNHLLPAGWVLGITALAVFLYFCEGVALFSSAARRRSDA